MGNLYETLWQDDDSGSDDLYVAQCCCEEDMTQIEEGLKELFARKYSFNHSEMFEQMLKIFASTKTLYGVN